MTLFFFFFTLVYPLPFAHFDFIHKNTFHNIAVIANYKNMNKYIYMYVWMQRRRKIISTSSCWEFFCSFLKYIKYTIHRIHNLQFIRELRANKQTKVTFTYVHSMHTRTTKNDTSVDIFIDFVMYITRLHFYNNFENVTFRTNYFICCGIFTNYAMNTTKL